MFIMNFANAIALLNPPPRRVTFKDDSDLEEVKVFDAIKCPGQEKAIKDQANSNNKQAAREFQQFESHNPEECDSLYNEWMVDEKGILIAKGEHAGQCGIFVKYGMVPGDVHVKLFARGGKFKRVIVDSSEISPGYMGSDEDEEETKDDLGPIMPEAEEAEAEEAKKEEEAVPSTIIGGKYAGKNCIILEYLPHKVRVQIVGSSLITCISRRSLGLDEKKTVWHTQPRRSPRIRAMMEASRKSQALGVDSP